MNGHSLSSLPSSSIHRQGALIHVAEKSVTFSFQQNSQEMDSLEELAGCC